MILVNPLKHLIIRPNPIYDDVVILETVTDSLELDCEIASADGVTPRQAFAKWASQELKISRSIFPTSGWVELDLTGTEPFDIIWEKAMNKLKNKDLYYGSTE